MSVKRNKPAKKPAIERLKEAAKDRPSLASRPAIELTEDQLYTHPRELEPMLPRGSDGTLEELALRLVREASALAGSLHPITRSAVVALLRQMNSYYSNLIEGHHTLPLDIEKALHKDYSAEPKKRALQLESQAHIEVQILLEDRLRAEEDLAICSTDFLRWVHYEFYSRMPGEFRVVTDSDGNTERFEPGELRHRNVKVGQHVAPHHKHLQSFLDRFQEIYEPWSLKSLTKMIACAAAHHRLAWIHPFIDGNGRVTRLFTNAYMIRVGLDSHGLWTVTRGLCRYKDQYIAALVGADQPRQGDLDGRGNLSESGLAIFCQFFLQTALDQVRFMTRLLDLPGLEHRIAKYVQRRSAFGLPEEAKYILVEVLTHGELARGEVPRITGKPERTARRILDETLKQGLVSPTTAKGPIRLAVPAKAVPYYFPNLYPEGVEAAILEKSE
ncbi:MAG TPA: Fic family protein [Terriglobia bacterium]|jgi:Fic family protein